MGWTSHSWTRCPCTPCLLLVLLFPISPRRRIMSTCPFPLPLAVLSWKPRHMVRSKGACWKSLQLDTLPKNSSTYYCQIHCPFLKLWVCSPYLVVCSIYSTLCALLDASTLLLYVLTVKPCMVNWLFSHTCYTWNFTGLHCGKPASSVLCWYHTLLIHFFK